MAVSHRIAAVLSCIVIVAVTAPAQPAGDPDAQFLRAIALQREGRLEEAERLLRSLLNAFPDYHDARVQYALLLTWRGNHSNALAQFDSVLAADPLNIEARFGKARTLEGMGRYRQSADILLALLESQPNSARILFALGRVFASGGAPRRALQYFEQAYLRLPSDPEIMRALGRVHRTLGNRDLSVYWYQKVLSAVPGDPEARAELQRQAFHSTHEIHLRGGYESFTTGGIPGHTLLQAEYYVTIHEDWKPFLHVSRVEKFSSKDLRAGAGVYGTPARGMGMFVQALVSPDAAIAPDIDATLEVSAGIANGVEASAGYRYLRFDTLNVHIAVPGIILYLSDEAWLGLRGFVGFIPSFPASHSLTADLWLRMGEGTTLRIGGFTGYEILTGTSFSEIAGVRSSGGHLSVKTRVSGAVALEGEYTYTSRSLPSSSHAASLGLLFFF